MWAIRMLSGPLAGNIFNLKLGKNKLGRADQCDIQVQTNGVSKEHIEFIVYPDKIIINDLKSSNGTFLNGVKIQSAIPKVGDKISAYNIVFDIVKMNETGSSQNLMASGPANNIHLPGVHNAYEGPEGANPYPGTNIFPNQGQAGWPSSAGNNPNRGKNPAAFSKNLGFFEKMGNYVDDTMLPGVYNLVHVFDFNLVIMGMLSSFVLAITILTVFPMNQITSDSIFIESSRRAMTVARALSQSNEKIIHNGDLSQISTDMVIKEEGIDDVYIVSAKDGSIIAPAEKSGMRPKETSFLKRAISEGRDITEDFKNGKVGAAVAINGFNPELRQNTPKAFVVVIYNTSGLTFDDGRVLSLFIQMLGIAIFLGYILYFFIYKLTEYPIKKLNEEIDLAIRERLQEIDLKIRIPRFKILITNVNTLLMRSSTYNENQGPKVGGKGFRDQEMFNIINLIGYASLLVSKENIVLKLNSAFEQMTMLSESAIQGKTLHYIPDQALQKNILNLIQQSQNQMNQISTDQLEINGYQYLINCQSVSAITGEAEYFIITIVPLSNEQGVAV